MTSPRHPNAAFPMSSHPCAAPLGWDLFCRVIDNHGDLGVAVRLARQLNARGERVRLWVDDASALAWMAPGLAAGPDDTAGLIARLASQTPASTLALPWSWAEDASALAALPPARTWVELFGCELPDAFVTHGVARAGDDARPVWLNLEYLSAEAYVARSHGLPSPIHSGPARGWTKWFFFPGFTPDTGGLLLAGEGESQTPGSIRPSPFPHERKSTDTPERLLTTLFCYEPPGLPAWLAAMAQAPHVALDWQLMPGRPQRAFQQALAQHWPGLELRTAQATALPGTAHRVRCLPHMPQPAFDAVLAASDLNFVRGEDSLVSGLRAGKPLVWHIYPQDDDAHHAKLMAFLRWLQAPPSLVRMHLAWNGVTTEAPPALTPAMLAEWQACLRDAQARLTAMPDLVSRLLAFVAGKACAQAGHG
jgi:uncharacterized repeat protein (TIGR03837 family)